MNPDRNNFVSLLSSLWQDAWERVPGSKRTFLAIALLSILSRFISALLSSGLRDLPVSQQFRFPPRIDLCRRVEPVALIQTNLPGDCPSEHPRGLHFRTGEFRSS